MINENTARELGTINGGFGYEKGSSYQAKSALGVALGNLDAARKAIAKKRCEQSFIAFVELFWPIIEPTQPFVVSWVQRAIAKHLEAVNEEKISKLLINVPPGFSKSTLVSVFFAAWEWGPRKRPDLRYIAWSYDHKLTRRDNGLCRRIVTSPLYQELWGQCSACKVRREGVARCKKCETERRFRLDGDTNAIDMYRNDWGGFRFASSVGGGGTGYRADRLIFDDPHSVQGAESDAERQMTIDWFAGTLPSRIRNASESTAYNAPKLPEWVRRAHGYEDEDQTLTKEQKEFFDSLPERPKPLKSATIGIMQRVHLRDVSGVILDTPTLGYVHICIEMEYEGELHPTRVANDNGETPSGKSPIGYVDPRKARLASVPPSIETGDEWWDHWLRLWLRIAVDMATLADPIRYPRHAVEDLKRSLRLKVKGGDPIAAQLQQWPQTVGGKFFPKLIKLSNDVEIDMMQHRVLEDHELLPAKCGWESRAYDLAATDSDKAAATVGVRIYIDINDRVIVRNVVKTRGEPDEVDALLLSTAKEDGRDVRINLPQDPGQGGKYQIRSFYKLLQGYPVDHSPEHESKEIRAYPLSSQWKIGNVYLVRGDWNREYLQIMSEFPVGRFKDETDATTRGYDAQVGAETVQRPYAPKSVKMVR